MKKILAVALLVTACTPKQIETGVDVLCRTHPDLCAPSRPVPTVAAATPTPDACTADPDYDREDCCGKCGAGERCARVGRCGGNPCFNCFPVTPTPIPRGTPCADGSCEPPTATVTPTPSPTHAGPGPTATPAPPSDPQACLRRDEVPAEAVPVFTGKPCRIGQGFVAVHDPGTNTDGCIRNWRCADGDQRFQPVAKIGGSLNGGGPNGVHRCADGEPPGPGFICDAARPSQEAYGRNMDGNGNVIVPDGVDHDTPWSRAGICKPVWCEATPVPTPATPAPEPVPTPPTAPCPCIVVVTVAFHGINDGPNPPLSAGEQAHFDATLRGAGHLGDGRGVACDKAPWTCVCEPEENPVEWSFAGGNGHPTNNGYGLRLSDLQSGTHTVSAKLREGAVDKLGRPVKPCSWPHGGEGANVRDSRTFDVQ